MPGLVGRVAEELIFGTDAVTGGASGDIRRATQVGWPTASPHFLACLSGVVCVEVAQEMVTTYGMSEKVGVTLTTTRRVWDTHDPYMHAGWPSLLRL